MPIDISLETKVAHALLKALLADVELATEITEGALVKGYVTPPSVGLSLINPPTLYIHAVPERDAMSRALGMTGSNLAHFRVTLFQWPTSDYLAAADITIVDWARHIENLIYAGDDGKGKLEDPDNVANPLPKLRYLTKRIVAVTRSGLSLENIAFDPYRSPEDDPALPVWAMALVIIASYELQDINLTTGKRQGEV